MFLRNILLLALSILSFYSFSQQLDSSLTYDYRNGNWVKYYRAYYNYNTSGNLSTITRNRLDNTNGWTNYSRDQRSYDSQGDLTYRLSENWNTNLSQWDSASTEEYVRDQQRKVTAYSYSIKGNGLWVTLTEDSNIYSTSGEILEKYRTSRQSTGQLLEQTKRAYTYSANLLDSMFIYRLDTSNSTYDLTEAVVYQYNNVDSIISEETIRYLGGTQWVPENRIENIYDQNNLKTIEILSFFRSGRYQESSIDSMSYYSFRKIDTLIRSSKPQSNQPIDYQELIKYYYSGNNSRSEQYSNESLLIYPNPAKDKAFIDCQNCGDQIQLFDLNGSLIKSYQWDENSRTISTENLPSGNYLIRSDEVSGRLILIH